MNIRKYLSCFLAVLTLVVITSQDALAYRDLETGTFITRDPAGMVDGPNLYTYVRQNPWTMFDPHGLDDSMIHGVNSGQIKYGGNAHTDWQANGGWPSAFAGGWAGLARGTTDLAALGVKNSPGALLEAAVAKQLGKKSFREEVTQDVSSYNQKISKNVGEATNTNPQSPNFKTGETMGELLAPVPPVAKGIESARKIANVTRKIIPTLTDVKVSQFSNKVMVRSKQGGLNSTFANGRMEIDMMQVYEDYLGNGFGTSLIENAVKSVDNVTNITGTLGGTNLKVFEKTNDVWSTPLGKSMKQLGYDNVNMDGTAVDFFKSSE